MLLKLIKWYAAYLVRKGRVDNRTIRSGETLFRRHYPLWISRPNSLLPNFVLHHIFNTFKPELAHDHGRFVISVILNGGYTEVRYRKDGSTYEVARRPFSVVFLGWNARHNIKDVLPDTWTIFAFGPKFRDAHFKHPVTGKILTRMDVDRLDKRKVSGYHLTSAALEAKILRRKSAMARLQRIRMRKVSIEDTL
jgi:hypothetical protein